MPNQPNRALTLSTELTVTGFLQAAKATNFDNEEAVAKFTAQFQSKLCNPAKNNANTEQALHILTGKKKTELQEYKPFLRWVCKDHPKLFEYKFDGLPPLHLAIKSGNAGFVRIVLDGMVNSKTLFAPEDTSHRSCLHFAISCESYLTKLIIEKAKELRSKLDDFNVFIKKDYLSLTPLRQAVVQGLQVKEAEGFRAEEPDTDVPDRADSASEEIEPFSTVQTIKDLVDAVDGALLEQDCNEDTPYQAIVRGIEDYLETCDKSREKDLEQFNIWWQDIHLAAMIIKNHCIRNMRRDDALKALYKVGDERVIEFDLSQLLSTTIDADFLKGLARVLRFESVLSYVALPRLSIPDEKELQEYLDDMEICCTKNEETKLAKASSPGMEKSENVAEEQENQGFKEKAKSNIESAGNKGKGLTNFCPIFRWLRNLNVDSIVEITVIDDVEPSHSDAAIEACLKGFKIESWNWKKFDICSDVIFNAAPDVKHVILYSSGNNAVLLGWSSSAGLCRLKKGLESRFRLNEYIEDFKTTLKSHNHLINFTVECTLGDPKESCASVFVDKGINLENNPWLQYMKDFAQFLQNAKPQAKPIYIAVIDDGINTKLDTFEGKIHYGDSFYDPTPDSLHSRRGVYYVPSGRHGTLMAQLICNVCPVVKLFVAQLQVAPRRGKERSFTTRSAIKAINWAVDHNVDIICMAWSIDYESSKGGDITELSSALLAAHSAGILMFCSCIDRGAALQDESFPGRSGYPFRIGAASASGEKLPCVAGPKSEYLLPGENVKPEEPDAWSHDRSGPIGSSIATALATGLAGALLYCDRLLDCRGKFEIIVKDKSDTTSNKTVVVDHLRDKAIMKTVLDRMSWELSGSKYIEVRNTLQKYLPNPKDVIWNRERDDEKAKSELQGFMNSMKGKVI